MVQWSKQLVTTLLDVLAPPEPLLGHTNGLPLGGQAGRASHVCKHLAARHARAVVAEYLMQDMQRNMRLIYSQGT